MCFLLVAILVLCGCGSKQGQRLDALYDAALNDLHAGEVAKAQLGAEQGMALATSRGDLQSQWKFRLLRSEVLLNSRRAEEVLKQRHDALPDAPEFAALAARKLTLEAWAVLSLGRTAESMELLA